MHRGLATLLMALIWVSLASAQTPQARPEPVSLQAVVKNRQVGADGKETLTLEVVMQIEKGWHAYANPAGDDIFVPTVVTVAGVAKDDVEIAYPRGKAHRDDALNLTVYHYEGKVVIPVKVRRPLVNGQPNREPLELSVRYQACSDASCLAPKTVKLTVSPAK